MNGFWEWLKQQNKWYVLLVAVLALAALWLFQVPLQDAWGALTGG